MSGLRGKEDHEFLEEAGAETSTAFAICSVASLRSCCVYSQELSQTADLFAEAGVFGLKLVNQTMVGRTDIGQNMCPVIVL